jgi:hypothetical protein
MQFIYFSVQIKDVSKAVRVAIQYAIDEAAEQKKIYTEKICTTCGNKNKEELNVELYPVQKAFLEDAVKKYSLASVDVSSTHPEPLYALHLLEAKADLTITRAEGPAMPARIRRRQGRPGRHLQDHPLPLLLSGGASPATPTASWVHPARAKPSYWAPGALAPEMWSRFPSTSPLPVIPTRQAAAAAACPSQTAACITRPRPPASSRPGAVRLPGPPMRPTGCRAACGFCSCVVFLPAAWCDAVALRARPLWRSGRSGLAPCGGGVTGGRPPAVRGSRTAAPSRRRRRGRFPRHGPRPAAAVRALARYRAARQACGAPGGGSAVPPAQARL